MARNAPAQAQAGEGPRNKGGVLFGQDLAGNASSAELEFGVGVPAGFPFRLAWHAINSNKNWKQVPWQLHLK